MSFKFSNTVNKKTDKEINKINDKVNFDKSFLVSLILLCSPVLCISLIYFYMNNFKLSSDGNSSLDISINKFSKNQDESDMPFCSVETVEEAEIIIEDKYIQAVGEVLYDWEVNPVEPPKELILKAPLICQYPNFPTGCEAISTTMLLNYYDIDISADEFVDDYLTCTDNTERFSPELKRLIKNSYTVSPYEMFVGSPRSYNGIACYSTVIENDLNYLLEDKNIDDYVVRRIQGGTVEDLCEKYIANDMPVVIWGTIDMSPVWRVETWVLNSKGDTFKWKISEHCLLLVGYDEEYYYFNDPQYSYVVSYSRDSVETAFSEHENQAVVMIPTDKGY